MYCQVVYICGCIPARIQHALVDLPETLDETYQRTLLEIKKANREFAHRLFQFVAVASRPLRVEELAELLAYDFEAGQIPKFHEGWRIEDPVDAVLSTCSSLLAIVDGGNGKVIQFSHFSVKEFLTSTSLAEATDIIPRRYHISITPAHTFVAQACLGILLHLDNEIVARDGLEKWPLAGYAAEHWADHARFGDVSRNVQDGMKQLLDPTKPHLAVCVSIHDPGLHPLERNRRAERPIPPLGTSLHYAALWGFDFIVEFLIIERSQDVHSRRFPNNATPLHLASKYGHVNAARMLIEHDADVAAQNKDGETPLHLASQEGQVEVTDMLTERGANVMAQNNHGLTPLHLASVLGQVQVALKLIERGADVTARNKYGLTPLHLASLQGQLEVAHLLIKHNVEVTARDKDSETPLHLALQEGHVEVADILIKRGADVTAQNKDGNAPLHLVSIRGQLEVACMLIEQGAEVTSRNRHWQTPLHLALMREQEEVAQLLIEHGADLTAQNKYGLTPLHLTSKGEPATPARCRS